MLLRVNRFEFSKQRLKIQEIYLKHTLQKQMEELRKQNTQLTYHIYMVSLENRQLWKRLTRIYQNNNKFSNQSTKASESTKFHPVPERPPPLTYSLREIPGFQDRNEKLSHLCDTGKSEYKLIKKLVLIICIIFCRK